MITLRTYEMYQIIGNELLHTTARALTLGGCSGMNIALDRYSAQMDDGRIIKAKGIFAYKGEQAVGWCLLTYESDGMDFAAQDGFACVQIYVHPNHRRQKIGAALLEEAQTIAKGYTIQCYHWSNPEFFSPFIKQGNFQSL